jgi:lysophospholipase L1-like esterase
VAFAGGVPTRVILVSIPDWGVTPFNTSRDRAVVAREIDTFNDVVRDEAARGNAHWVEVTDLTRAAPLGVVADGLHPSAAMYAQWTARLTEVASAIFTSTLTDNS